MKMNVVLAALLLAGVAHAGRFDFRAHSQASRIATGASNGTLNAFEQARLNHGQARVAYAQARASADGVVGPREARRINRLQNFQSRMIYRGRHNAF